MSEPQSIETCIRGNLEMILRAHDLTSQVRNWAQRALAASDRIDNITASMLRLSGQKTSGQGSLQSLRLIMKSGT